MNRRESRPSSIARRSALFDLAVLIACCAVYALAEALHVAKRWTFLGTAVALIGYGVVLARRGDDSLRDLGFRTDNLRPALVHVGAWTIALALVIVVWARLRGLTIWRADLLALLPLYPIWGIAQQAIFQGLVHRRLMVLVRSEAVQIVLTAAVFASVHVGNTVLVALTFAVGLLWSWLYRRWPNLWALGLSHGALAAFAYPLVLDDAPLGRI